MNNYEKLTVFQKSHQLVLRIYQIVENFPKHEKYRLVDQMVRASYSIPSNIVEGNSKNTTKDLYYINQEIYQSLSSDCDTVAKMLNGLINALKEKKNA